MSTIFCCRQSLELEKKNIEDVLDALVKSVFLKRSKFAQTCAQIGQVFVLVPFGPRTVMTSREQLIFPQFFKPTSFVSQNIVPPGHCD